MSNIVIIEQRHYTKTGSVAERTKTELHQKGFSHIWNETDFCHHFNQVKQQARKRKAPIHYAWAALEIAETMIKENWRANSDFLTLND